MNRLVYGNRPRGSSISVSEQTIILPQVPVQMVQVSEDGLEDGIEVRWKCYNVAFPPATLTGQTYMGDTSANCG